MSIRERGESVGLLIEQYQVEQFLYREAELLDERKYEKWLELFTDTGIYEMPPLDTDAEDPINTSYLIHDERIRLESRVRQLAKGLIISENPPSKTARSITNVLIRSEDETKLTVRSTFIVQRSRRSEVHQFCGAYRHELIRSDRSFKIARRTVYLAQDHVHQGRISFIL